MKNQLLFVYNADSDLFSTVTDFAHKLLSPSTYQCQLCALTYGNFGMKQEWKSFIENLPIDVLFLHKDEFKKRYELETDLPAVFTVTGEAIKEVITKQTLDTFESLEELKNLVTEKFQEHVQHHHTNL